MTFKKPSDFSVRNHFPPFYTRSVCQQRGVGAAAVASYTHSVMMGRFPLQLNNKRALLWNYCWWSTSLIKHPSNWFSSY